MAWIRFIEAKHPLPPGTKLLSVLGEEDEGDDGNGNPTGKRRHTGPIAIAETDDRPQHNEGQGWTYSVIFPNGTWVYIDETDARKNPTNYWVEETPSPPLATKIKFTVKMTRASYFYEHCEIKDIMAKDHKEAAKIAEQAADDFSHWKPDTKTADDAYTDFEVNGVGVPTESWREDA